MILPMVQINKPVLNSSIEPLFVHLSSTCPMCRHRWPSWTRVRLVIRGLRVRLPPGRRHSCVETDHEIFSTIILSLPLIQEGQWSVSGKRMCTILVNRLED